MQSVELLLDAASDHLVREQWRALSAAGLPSQADHLGPTNAPHVTLVVRDAVDPDREQVLRSAASLLPLPLRLGGLAVFGRHRYVLARLVVPDRPLLALHAAVAEAVGPDGPGTRLTEPGRWTPHVTLARGLDAAGVGHAVEALAGSSPVEATAVDCRRWDSEARRAWSVLDG